MTHYFLVDYQILIATDSPTLDWWKAELPWMNFIC